MSTDSVKTASLRTCPVSELSGEFLVASYQRGYRWGAVEVNRLLDDIYGVPEREPYYYLQPIVVKAVADGQWELVDGQQRLTTLYLVLRFLQRKFGEELAPMGYSLSYETRPGSADFLKEPDPEGRGHNIDFHHMYAAHRCIESWFQTSAGSLDAGKMLEMLRLILNKVAVIWYQAEPGQDSRELFTRLNVGRIPLTDAELVKALVLTRAKGDVGWADHAQEIAAQWDSIEKDLRNGELWAFVSGKADDDPTHIGLLLDILAGGDRGRGRPLYQTFESLRPEITSHESALDFWNRVVGLYSLVVGWFEDHDLFHKIGYLVTSGEDIATLAALASEQTKDAFDAALDGRIRTRLDLTESKLSELRYRARPVMPALVLMNVETVRRRSGTNERFSFQAHASKRWSEEHIHAQNAPELQTEADRRDWLKSHLAALQSTPLLEATATLVSEIKDTLVARVSKDTFNRLQGRVTALLTDGEGLDMHHISNLALLDSGDNSALSNSVFEVKRREIIRRDKEGLYIPVCTRHVFFKYYTTAAAQQLHFWGAQDREAYLEQMIDILRPYLQPDTDEALT